MHIAVAGKRISYQQHHAVVIIGPNRKTLADKHHVCVRPTFAPGFMTTTQSAALTQGCATSATALYAGDTNQLLPSQSA